MPSVYFCPKRLVIVAALILVGSAVATFSTPVFAQAQTCPTLQAYYPNTTPVSASAWAARLPAIEALLENCLTSAEYFALLGAARLNTGQVPQALEALERALLLDPQHGAAQIDYAEGLFLVGQLFPALELNGTLLNRSDLPAQLQPMLAARQRFWQRQTFTQKYLVETTVGYDSNLNGAPTKRDITLTQGGTPVSLTLDAQYQRVEGAFANVRLGGYWQQQAATHSHALLATARFRGADQSVTDLAQADWRYSFTLPSQHHWWEFSAGGSYLSFGGSGLYSVLEGRARLQWGVRQTCQPGVEAGVQQLHYYGQRVIDGVEARLSASYNCTLNDQQRFVVEAGGVQNQAQHPERPGGDRQGWNVRLGWQYQLGKHQFGAEASLAQLKDERGYSPLLNSGAVRNVRNQSLALRYQWTFDKGGAAVLNISQQKQRSNLQPFTNSGAVVEVGLLLDF
jgi:hypothetical protein